MASRQKYKYKTVLFCIVSTFCGLRLLRDITVFYIRMPTVEECKN